MLLVFDLGTMVFLVFLLAHRGLDFRWLILYALNPVVLYGFAGQGHFDVMQGFVLTCSLFFYDRRQWKWMFLLAGLLFQVKYVAALCIPFLVNRRNWRHSWLALFSAVLPYLLFLWAIDHENVEYLFKSIYEFGGNFAFNGSVHGVLRLVFGGIGPATKICAVLLLICLGFGLVHFHPERNSRYRNDPVSGCFFVLGCVILLAPTIHFWYLSWIVPFLVLRPSRPWLLLCLTIGFYFVANGISHHTGMWRLPMWAGLGQWLPFYVLLIFQGIFFVRQLGSGMDSVPPGSVSVVIPAKDEEARIVSCISAAFEDPAVTEVIVVDGGSLDRTRIRAAKAGARVLTHPRSLETGGGRGCQIRAGIDAATGDLVAVVHADVIVKAPGFTKMCHVLARDPRLAGGALGSVFESAKGLLTLISVANDWRMVFLGISFGDQVQFFRRDAVASAKLFRECP